MQALDRGMVLPTRYTFNADGTAIYLTGDVDARSTESALHPCVMRHRCLCSPRRAVINV